MRNAPLLLVKEERATVTGSKTRLGGAWVTQLVKGPASAQVMISRFVSSSPALGSVLTAQSLDPASDSESPSLSAPPLLALSQRRLTHDTNNSY